MFWGQKEVNIKPKGSSQWPCCSAGCPWIQAPWRPHSSHRLKAHQPPNFIPIIPGRGYLQLKNQSSFKKQPVSLLVHWLPLYYNILFSFCENNISKNSHQHSFSSYPLFPTSPLLSLGLISWFLVMHVAHSPDDSGGHWVFITFLKRGLLWIYS